MNALDRLVSELATNDPAGTSPVVHFDTATVATVDVAGASDGSDLITVTWRGTDVAAARIEPCPDLPAIAVDDVVLVMFQQPVLLIVGRIVGAPPEE